MKNSTPQSIKTARKRPVKGGSLYHMEKITALSDLGKGLYMDPLGTEAEITALALETIKA